MATQDVLPANIYGPLSQLKPDLPNLRHKFSCNSENLITCTKCRKQYVGMTTQKLNVTSIFTNRRTFLHKHFNLPDHSIKNLTVQGIDKVSTDLGIQNELTDLPTYRTQCKHCLVNYTPILYYGKHVHLSDNKN